MCAARRWADLTDPQPLLPITFPRIAEALPGGILSAEEHHAATLFVVSHSEEVARFRAGSGHLFPLCAVQFPGITLSFLLTHATEQHHAATLGIADHLRIQARARAFGCQALPLAVPDPSITQALLLRINAAV